MFKKSVQNNSFVADFLNSVPDGDPASPPEADTKGRRRKERVFDRITGFTGYKIRQDGSRNLNKIIILCSDFMNSFLDGEEEMKGESF